MCIETYEPAPSRALDASGSRVEFLRELVERAPALDDGLLKATILEGTAMALILGRGGREIFPKEGVVDVPYTFEFTRDKITCVSVPVGGGRRRARKERKRSFDDRPRARKMNFFLRTSTIKLQGRLKGDAFLGGRGFGVRLLGGVEGIDVSLMVLLVMKLHDLT
jgi:hypothetical protein